LEFEQTVIVDGIGGVVKSLIQDEWVDRGLASQHNVVLGDLLCREFLDIVYGDFREERLSLFRLPLPNQHI
jgi:hypothetical protein